jgi:hypothetical protein
VDGAVPAEHGDRLVDRGAVDVTGVVEVAVDVGVMSRRIRVISCWLGAASTRAQSSTPSMAAASRSRVRSRSSRWAVRSGR